MLKVVHLLSSSSLSGAEKVAISIMKLRSDDVIFYYASPLGKILENLRFSDIKYIEISINPYSIFKMLRSEKPDIIHAHDFKASAILGLLPYSGIKISHIHQNPNWLYSINAYSIIYFFSCFFLDSIVSVSKHVFTDKSIFNKFFSKKISVINNAIDFKNIHLLSKRKLTAEEKHDLLFVGRLSEEKDPIRFIQLVKEVKAIKPEIRAAMIGDGKLYKICEEVISDEGLLNNIKMYGFLDNPFPIMKESKLLLITSKIEGFGLAAVESLSLGVPVLATPVGGLLDIVTNSNGSLCYTNQDFITAIFKFLDDQKLLKNTSKISKISSERYKTQYNWIEFYRSLILKHKMGGDYENLNL